MKNAPPDNRGAFHDDNVGNGWKSSNVVIFAPKNATRRTTLPSPMSDPGRLGWFHQAALANRIACADPSLENLKALAAVAEGRARWS
jgi:hypothetical protein